MDTIGQGTTPYLEVTITDCDLSDAVVVYWTIKQGNKILVNLTGERVSVSVNEDGGSSLIAHLTQEETLSLQKADTQMQVRWKNTDGEAFETEIFRTRITEALFREVI